MSLSERLESALVTAGHTDRDGAAVELAMAYALDIDTGGDLDKLGPKLLACLEALLLTPRARAALTKGKDDEPRTSPVDELRRRRALRAKAVDPTAP